MWTVFIQKDCNRNDLPVRGLAIHSVGWLSEYKVVAIITHLNILQSTCRSALSAQRIWNQETCQEQVGPTPVVKMHYTQQQSSLWGSLINPPPLSNTLLGQTWVLASWEILLPKIYLPLAFGKYSWNPHRVRQPYEPPFCANGDSKRNILEWKAV